MNFFKPKEEKKTFWLVWLEEATLLLGLVTSAGEVIAIQKAKWKKKEDIIHTLNTCRQKIIFPKKPEAVFFVLPKNWLSAHPQEALVRISEDLGWKFLGYASRQKAVLEFFRQREGVPPNLLLLTVSQEKCTVALIRQGELIEERKEQTEKTLRKNLEKILEKFAIRELPPRLVILGADDLEKTRETIAAFPFGKSGCFLHLPRIGYLRDEEKIQAGGLLGRQRLEEETERERFGFVIGEDVFAHRKKGVKEARPQAKGKKLPSLFSFLRQISLPPIPKSSLLVLGGILAFLLLLFSLSSFLPRARIVIFVQSEAIRKTEEVLVASADFESSPSGEVLKVAEVKVEVEGNLSTPTTGTKLVGEKARGKVVVYNKTLTPKNFPKGTKIIGPNSLKFAFEDSVSLDPATISTSSGSETKTYGRAEVGVIAEDIGEEYNLPGGIDFALLGFSPSLYSAHSEKGFSGGSSRKISVVSEVDREKLEKELSNNLHKEAEKKLGEKIKEKLFGETIELKIKEKIFDHEIGEEAEVVSLSLKGEGRALDISSERLKEFLLARIKKEITADWELLPTKIKIEPRVKEKRGETLVLAVDLELNLIPHLEIEEIKKMIAGKREKEAKKYLSSLPHVRDVQIKISPSFPTSLLPLPNNPKRISLAIRPE